jgi:hypothetical protein
LVQEGLSVEVYVHVLENSIMDVGLILP